MRAIPQRLDPSDLPPRNRVASWTRSSGPRLTAAGRFPFLTDPRYLAGLDRLTPDQARKVHDAFQPATGYLWRMLGRMDVTNLRLADPNLYALVVAARDAMHALTVELQYENCECGVDQPDRRPESGRVGPAGDRLARLGPSYLPTAGPVFGAAERDTLRACWIRPAAARNSAATSPAPRGRLMEDMSRVARHWSRWGDSRSASWAAAHAARSAATRWASELRSAAVRGGGLTPASRPAADGSWPVRSRSHGLEPRP